MPNIKFPFPIEDLKIILRRTACYGTCPVYELYLDGKGIYQFNGDMFVEKIGIHTLDFEPWKLISILNEAMDIGFWGLENKYKEPMECELGDSNTVQYISKGYTTCKPSTEIEIHIGKKIKKVNAYEGQPDRFDKFAEFIDLMCRANEFIGK